MSPDVGQLAELLTVITAFGTAVAVIALGIRFVVMKTRAPSLGSSKHAAPIDDGRFARLEQAVDAIAIEVERIAEAQRFSAKLMSERLPQSLPGDSNSSSETRR